MIGTGPRLVAPPAGGVIGGAGASGAPLATGEAPPQPGDDARLASAWDAALQATGGLVTEPQPAGVDLADGETPGSLDPSLDPLSLDAPSLERWPSEAPSEMVLDDTAALSLATALSPAAPRDEEQEDGREAALIPELGLIQVGLPVMLDQVAPAPAPLLAMDDLATPQRLALFGGQGTDQPASSETPAAADGLPITHSVEDADAGLFVGSQASSSPDIVAPAAGVELAPSPAVAPPPPPAAEPALAPLEVAPAPVPLPRGPVEEVSEAPGQSEPTVRILSQSTRPHVQARPVLPLGTTPRSEAPVTPSPVQGAATAPVTLPTDLPPLSMEATEPPEAVHAAEGEARSKTLHAHHSAGEADEAPQAEHARTRDSAPKAESPNVVSSRSAPKTVEAQGIRGVAVGPHGQVGRVGAPVGAPHLVAAPTQAPPVDPLTEVAPALLHRIVVEVDDPDGAMRVAVARHDQQVSVQVQAPAHAVQALQSIEPDMEHSLADGGWTLEKFSAEAETQDGDGGQDAPQGESGGRAATAPDHHTGPRGILDEVA